MHEAFPGVLLLPALYWEWWSLKRYQHIGGNWGVRVGATTGKHIEGKSKGPGNKPGATAMETPPQIWAGWRAGSSERNFSVVVNLNLRGGELCQVEKKKTKCAEQKEQHPRRLIGCKEKLWNLENQQGISVWLESRVCVCVCLCVHECACICVDVWVYLCVYVRPGWWQRLERKARLRSLKTICSYISWVSKELYILYIHM